MTERFSSTKWTGPWKAIRPHRGIFTHAPGAHGYATDYQRIFEARRAAEAIPGEVRGVMGLGALLLFGSPLILWIAWQVLRWSSSSIIVADNRDVLVAWGLAMIALGLWQVLSRSPRLVLLRKAILLLALVATFAVAAAYLYAGIDARRNARASAPERTYVLARSCGRGCVTAVHQRADGTTVEGIDMGPPVEFARICSLVQRLDGAYGFSWVRVLQRTRAPRGGELPWPIRREECFSAIPLSELPR